MNHELNPEQVKKLGWRWTEAFLAQLPIEERLKGLKPQEVVSQYAPQERLQGLKPQEVLSQYAPQERLQGLKPQEVVSQFAPQELLDQFDSKQIEEYLNFHRKKAQKENT